MTNQQIADELRYITKTDSSQITDEDFVKGLNIDRAEVIMDILQARGDYNFQEKHCTIDLKSTLELSEGDNGYNGEYAFPANMIRPIRIEVSYDGISYSEASFYDINSNHGSEVSGVNQGFSTSSPFVRFDRDSLYIRPLKDTAGDVPKGIHIWYEFRQTDFTSSDMDKIPEGEPNFHREYVLRGAIRWGLRNPDKMQSNWSAVLSGIQSSRRKFYADQFKVKKQFRPRIESYA